MNKNNLCPRTLSSLPKVARKSAGEYALESIITALDEYFEREDRNVSPRDRALNFAREFEREMLCFPDLFTIEQFYKTERLVHSLQRADGSTLAKQEVGHFYGLTGKEAGAKARAYRQRQGSIKARDGTACRE